jgi:4,5-dihydroxyphthalate decarboxylase
MVVRRSIAEKNPWVITNLLTAFRRAGDIAERERAEHVDYHLETGLLPADARDALKTRLVAHGIKANRKVLETAAQYSAEQGLTPRLVKLDEVFAPATMDE